tara:strand:+ start:433 stop:723 length:291 start_codon:yes stop_codon:yes gene_type:complete
MNQFDKMLVPVCSFLKKNSKNINFFLIVVYIVLTLPIDSLFKTNIQYKVYSALDGIFDNPVGDLFFLLLIYCAFRNYDVMMLLLLILYHRRFNKTY